MQNVPARRGVCKHCCPPGPHCGSRGVGQPGAWCRLQARAHPVVARGQCVESATRCHPEGRAGLSLLAPHSSGWGRAAPGDPCGGASGGCTLARSPSLTPRQLLPELQRCGIVLCGSDCLALLPRAAVCTGRCGCWSAEKCSDACVLHHVAGLALLIVAGQSFWGAPWGEDSSQRQALAPPSWQAEGASASV